MLRNYSWLGAQGSLLPRLTGPWDAKLESEVAACKARAQPLCYCSSTLYSLFYNSLFKLLESTLVVLNKCDTCNWIQPTVLWATVVTWWLVKNACITCIFHGYRYILLVYTRKLILHFMFGLFNFTA